MFAQHLLDGRRGVLIGRELVLHLHVVFGQLAYFALALAAQRLAHAAEHGRNYAVVQIVPAHIEIRGLRRDAQAEQLFAQGFIARTGLGKLMLKAVDLAVHPVAQRFERLLGVIIVELVERDGTEKVEHRKGLVVSRAVGPDGPHEKRPDDFGKTRHEAFEIEQAAVVERGHDANVFERGGIAFVVFDGVDVGVENVRVRAHYARRLGGSLHEVVVIGIDAGYHAAPQARSELVHKGYLLSLAQGRARRKHHFEIVTVGLDAAQQVAPEENVVVAFDVSHNFPAGPLGVQTVGSLDVSRVEIL